jgi:hypothetical protein
MSAADPQVVWCEPKSMGESPTRQRRGGGGSRREASERVVMRSEEGVETIGWTLNVSRGGLRLVVEDLVDEGAVYDIVIGDDPRVRRARVVWIQVQADGEIVGLQFLGVEGSVPPPPPDPSSD